ncbi:hypothetical protein PG984_005116 [Apiospora sp. TS-2023a]
MPRSRLSVPSAAAVLPYYYYGFYGRTNLQDTTLNTIDTIHILLYQAPEVTPAAMGSSYPITSCPTDCVIFDSELLNLVTTCDHITAAESLTESAAVLGTGRVEAIITSRTLRVAETEKTVGVNSVA